MTTMRSFIPVAPHSHFPIQNLPYGVFSTPQDPTPRIGVAIGDHILDLKSISKAGLFSGPLLTGTTALEQSTLNAFMALGRPSWVEARSTLHHLLSDTNNDLKNNAILRAQCLVPQSQATMHLPATIGDYTDFFCSKEHAVNCGLIFRGKDTPLNPNWLHLPVAYHGRSSSIVVSGTDVHRPWGQVSVAGSGGTLDIVFQPSAVVDFEFEMGCFIGPGNRRGTPISVDEAVDHIFGFVIVNDWSARDIQKWEYVPLGPFNSKNWATSISPWVVTPDALGPFAVPPPPQHPPPLPYLTPRTNPEHNVNYDVHLEAFLAIPRQKKSVVGSANNRRFFVTKSNMKTLYWTLPQMIAHHTAGGCNLRPGDLIATGTLSSEEGQGCLLELSWAGQRKVKLSQQGTPHHDDDDNDLSTAEAAQEKQQEEEEERTFLQDGDQVILTAYCQSAEGYRIGFGECRGTLLPPSY